MAVTVWVATLFLLPWWHDVIVRASATPPLGYAVPNLVSGLAAGACAWFVPSLSPSLSRSLSSSRAAVVVASGLAAVTMIGVQLAINAADPVLTWDNSLPSALMQLLGLFWGYGVVAEVLIRRAGRGGREAGAACRKDGGVPRGR